jgi:thiol:disulfide interchange protein DsbC
MKRLWIKSVLGLALAGVGLATSVANEFDTRLLDEVRKLKIENLIDIPIQSLKAVEREGEIHYISNNGRYVLQGRLVDVLQQKPLDTMQQIAFATQKLSIRDLNVDLNTLNTITIGEGSTSVIAYVDPRCDSCIRLMEDAQVLSDKYTFYFLVVPALGKESDVLARKVMCAVNRETVFDAFIEQKMHHIPTKQPCDFAGYDLTLLLADMTGVNGVPIVVAPNGNIARGRPIKLNAWIQENMK